MTRAVRTAVRLVPLALALAVGSAHAGVTSARGIFLIAEDFTNGRLTSESDCKSADRMVQLRDILNKPYIQVMQGGQTRKYLKNEIYGFRTCDGRDYRFVGNRKYQILEVQGLSIYSIEMPAREGQNFGHDRGTVREYFFSAGSGGPVAPLTRENVKRALPDNHRFHDSLDRAFTSDASLAQYDTFHKMFTVNRLLIASHER